MRSSPRKSFFSPVVGFALMLTAAAAPRAAEYRIECPPKLEPVAMQVVNPPDGWTAHVPSGLWLHSAGPMDGPPSDMAILKEDFYSKRGNKTTTRWVWGAKDGTYRDGKWMACNYGDGNQVILSQRIDGSTSECTVTTTKNQFGRNDIDIRCKS